MGSGRRPEGPHTLFLYPIYLPSVCLLPSYGMVTDICCIFQTYHNSNVPLLNYAPNVPSVCRALWLDSFVSFMTAFSLTNPLDTIKNRWPFYSSTLNMWIFMATLGFSRSGTEQTYSSTMSLWAACSLRGNSCYENRMLSSI